MRRYLGESGEQVDALSDSRDLNRKCNELYRVLAKLYDGRAEFILEGRHEYYRHPNMLVNGQANVLRRRVDH